MCGRYTLYDVAKSQLNIDIDIEPNYNVSPSSEILVINNNMKIEYAYWSLKPSWSDKINIINARSETLDAKDIFKNAERCIFIANGYYEWKKISSKKVPYYHTNSNKIMYFGGIIKENRACIVTRNSYSTIKNIHHRQPVILGKNTFDMWFSKKHNYECKKYSEIEIYRVSNSVNNPANNFYENIKKLN